MSLAQREGKQREPSSLLAPIFGDARLRQEWRANWRARRLGEKVLLTSDHGTWDLLTQSEYQAVRSIAITASLLERLEQKGLVLTANNAARVEAAWREWCGNYFSGTSLHILGVTRRCNLKCAYCHVSVVREDAEPERFDMPRQVGFDIVDFIFQSPSPEIHIEFQGGEPTLNMPLLRSVYDYAILKNQVYRRKLTFSIVSNLVDLSDDAIAFLRDAQISVSTSVEFSEQGVETALRVDEQGADRRGSVESNRRKLDQVGVGTHMLVVVASNNVGHLRRLIDHLVERGQTDIFLSPIQYAGFAKGNWNCVGVDAETFFAHWRDAMEYIFTLWDQGVLVMERQFSLAIQKLFGKTDVRYMDFRNPSGLVLGNLAYDHKGDIYASDEARGHASFRLGNVSTTTYQEAVTSNRAQQLVSYSLREHETCRLCAYKPWCGVNPLLSKLETGNPDPQPLEDFMCKRTLNVFDFVCSLLEERPHRIDQALMILSSLYGE